MLLRSKKYQDYVQKNLANIVFKYRRICYFHCLLNVELTNVFLFEECGEKPNSTTFVGVFFSCTHRSSCYFLWPKSGMFRLSV